MTAKSDLTQAIQRLTHALSQMDGQAASAREQAKQVRVNLARHITLICDDLDGKSVKCEKHPREKAHNCAVCRSEKIAVREYPEVDPEAQRLSARIVGERHEEERAW